MPNPTPTPNEPVPAVPLCDVPGIAAFRAGHWNGEHFNAAFVKQLADNYAKFAAPDPKTGQPWYVPYVSINHDKFPHLAGFQFGQLQNVHVDNSGAMTLDAQDVPAEVGSWINSKMLRNPSIEFVRPKKDARGKIVSGFVGPDGKFVDGPVIKCLTFLGNDIPGVKGSAELPPAVFSHRPAAPVSMFATAGLTVSTFGGSGMDRNAMIAALQAAGMDTSWITEAVPDIGLQAMLALVQGANANPNPAPETPPPTPMSAAGAGAGAAGVTSPGTTGGGGLAGLGAPASVLMKFNEQFPGLLGSLGTAVTTLHSQAAAATRINTRIIDTAKRTAIDQFFDRMAKSGQISTGAQPAYRALLDKCSHSDVRKFNDGKAEGSELDAAMFSLESTLPKSVTFGPKVQQRPVDSNGGGSGMSPERRARMLKGAGVTPAKVGAAG